MNQPDVVKVTWHGDGSRYTVNRPNWDGDEVVSLEGIARYVEHDCGCLMAIVPGETKHAYGLRLLKALAEEIRAFKRS